MQGRTDPVDEPWGLRQRPCARPARFPSADSPGPLTRQISRPRCRVNTPQGNALGHQIRIRPPGPSGMDGGGDGPSLLRIRSQGAPRTTAASAPPQRRSHPPVLKRLNSGPPLVAERPSWPPSASAGRPGAQPVEGFRPWFTVVERAAGCRSAVTSCLRRPAAGGRTSLPPRMPRRVRPRRARPTRGSRSTPSGAQPRSRRRRW